MTQRNISRATSRVTECLFHIVVFDSEQRLDLLFRIVVFAFSILFDYEQRLDDYILCQRAKKSPRYCVICIFRAKMRYVFLREMTKSLISGRMDVENNISTVIFHTLTR